MKTQEQRVVNNRHRLVEADIDATLDALFNRWPMLCGFAVCDAAPLLHERPDLPETELYVTEVSVFPMRSLNAPAELCQEIVASLAVLMDECPEACDLLRDRTFSRVTH